MSPLVAWAVFVVVLVLLGLGFFGVLCLMDECRELGDAAEREERLDDLWAADGPAELRVSA